jgi:hypothetical protein
MDLVCPRRVTAICPSLVSHYGHRAAVGVVPDPPRFFFSLFHHVTSTPASCPYITYFLFSCDFAPLPLTTLNNSRRHVAELH